MPGPNLASACQYDPGQNWETELWTLWFVFTPCQVLTCSQPLPVLDHWSQASPPDLRYLHYSPAYYLISPALLLAAFPQALPQSHPCLPWQVVWLLHPARPLDAIHILVSLNLWEVCLAALLGPNIILLPSTPVGKRPTSDSPCKKKRKGCLDHSPFIPVLHTDVQVHHPSLDSTDLIVAFENPDLFEIWQSCMVKCK